MASKLIMKSIGENTFMPDRAITRGEFLSVIIKCLGIYKTGTDSSNY